VDLPDRTARDAEYTEWVGRTETVPDALAVSQALAAAVMYDLPDQVVRVGGALPPLWQWFYFLPRAPQAQLASDGHPPKGGFLPPIPYPRRMFAGGRLTFHRPLVVGTPAERVGTIRDVTLKQGRSGALAFVRVGYQYVQAGAVAIEEEQDIVYREPGAAVPAPAVVPFAPPAPGQATRDVMPDTRLLFRFSALTFNAHRIHYDRDYARAEEGYPGLVVHGPLIAMQLMALARDVAPGEVTTFEFRSERPVFDLAAYRLQAETKEGAVELTALGPDGEVAQRARAGVGVVQRG
jgi:3-methylfumaryl-CoA hydratase